MKVIVVLCAFVPQIKSMINLNKGLRVILNFYNKIKIIKNILLYDLILSYK